jgi:hypothetical protein
MASMDEVPANASFWIAHDLSEASWDDSSLDFDEKSSTLKFSVSTNSSSLQFAENGSISLAVRASYFFSFPR